MAQVERGWVVIRGGLVADAAQRRAEPADILVEDGVIRTVGPALDAPEAARVEDASGLLLHPGLVNAHTHGHGGLARGLADAWTLELLLAAGPWMGGGRSLQDKKLSAQLCAAEMALKGVTAAYDLYAEAPVPTREGMDAAAEAYAEVGLRAVIAPMVADRTVWDAVPGLRDALPDALRAQVDALRPAPGEATLAAMGEILSHWRWAGQDIRAALAPTIPLHCADDFLCGCQRLAAEHGAPLQSHVAESKLQALAGLDRYGKTLVQHLDALGLVGPGFSAAHGIWLTDDDLRLMADRGAAIAHNPGSNMRLGNGMFRLRRALDLGVTVGIGTDGVSSSDTSNMYEAMRAAFQLAAVQGPDPAEWVTAPEAWRAGTLGSARALGFADIGAIAPGMKADIVFLDLQHPNWMPLNHAVNQIIHTEDGNALRHVMVGGRVIVRDRKLLTVDLAKLAREAEAARARLEALNAEKRGLFALLEPVVRSFCPAFARRPYPVRRYLCDPA
ncbi:amidohydrolase family protein [Paracraurococcus ruber]|uniref:Amidohydrolase n=1 Tax=Paracraurococcus ruber TaxID=77675 RepID=A0ABS1D5V7_9PROT|nr:amidohydrolase family protein [Paracraurococcus ruber]MBK1661657.1 amidohydrolase [Paracraurococcus ruber]TDG26618.1 amidohydrolase [Paracraurococcus ruber]